MKQIFAKGYKQFSHQFSMGPYLFEGMKQSRRKYNKRPNSVDYDQAFLSQAVNKVKARSE